MASENFNLQPEILEDDLVVLKPVSENAFASFFEIASDPLIWEFHPEKDRYKKEVFQKYFDGAVASQSSFLVFDKATRALIGSSRYYNYEPGLSRVAIGYTFLARKYWGGRYNRSMKSLMLNHAFKYVNSVVFHIGQENIRSQKAPMKLGAKKNREFDFSNTGKLTHAEFELTSTDWKANSL